RASIHAGTRRLEAIVGHHPCSAYRLPRSAHAHVGIQHAYVAEVRTFGEKTRELLERSVDGAACLAGPGKGRAAAPHERNVFIPQVQRQRGCTCADAGAIGEDQRVVGLPQLEPEETPWVEGIFEHAAPPAKPAVQGEYRAFQQRVTAKLPWRDLRRHRKFLRVRIDRTV